MLNVLYTLMMILYIPSCLGLIIIVLLQKGKGVGFAGAFGMGGGSDTVFGPRASKSFPQKLTYVMAGLFMTMALLMSLIVGHVNKGEAPEAVAEGISAADESAADVTGLEDLGSKASGAATAETAPKAATPSAPAAADTATAPAEAPAPETPAK